MTKSGASPALPSPILSATLTDARGCHVFGAGEEALNSLRALLQNSRLAVLTGSGTSYGLRGKAGFAPMMSDLMDVVRKLPTYADLIIEHPAMEPETNVEVLLSKAQALAALGGPGGDVEQFIDEATTAIRDACDFVDETTDIETHLVFLRKMVARTAGKERLALFTTNYDLALETALRNQRVAIIDGFGYGSRMRFSGGNYQQDLVLRGPKGELQLAPEVARLFKLHGSVDWDEHLGGIYRSDRPQNPVLIYPSANKYQQSYRQPFLEAMAQYQSVLRTSETTLVIVGFGFNDAHLNQPIIDTLLGDPTFKVIVAGPDVLTSANPVLKQLRESIAAGDGRIGLLASKFGELARLLPEPPTTDPWQETQAALQSIWGRP